jgi:hypothetical protein
VGRSRASSIPPGPARLPDEDDEQYHRPDKGHWVHPNLLSSHGAAREFRQAETRPPTPLLRAMHQIPARWDLTVAALSGGSMRSSGPATRWRSTARSLRADPIITSSRPWGEWIDGLIEGDLIPVGWGAALGYPGFRPREGGAAVAVQVLTTPSLAAAWPTLDCFEGPGNQRILVPVFGTEPGPGQAGERRMYTVANLYAVTEASPDF